LGAKTVSDGEGLGTPLGKILQAGYQGFVEQVPIYRHNEAVMKIRSARPIVTVDSMMTKVASVYEHHRTPFGRPADLEDFLQALQQDKHLAMDFWAVVSRLSEDPSEPSCPESSAAPTGEVPSSILPEMTLEAIVRVTTGLTVSEMRASGDGSRQAVVRLENLLAGKDAACDTPVSDAPVAPVDCIDKAHDTASLHGENYKNALRARLDETKQACSRQDASLVSAGSPLHQAIAPGSEQPGARPNPLPMADAAKGPPIGEANSPVARKGDDELRRLLFGSAYATDLVMQRSFRLRLPMWLRIWLQMWQPIVPPERKPLSKGLMTGYAIALLMACTALLYAQRSGSIEHCAERIGSLMGANAEPGPAAAFAVGHGSGQSESAPPAAASAAKPSKVGAAKLKRSPRTSN
jgi:hypothetical protein